MQLATFATKLPSLLVLAENLKLWSLLATLAFSVAKTLILKLQNILKPMGDVATPFLTITHTLAITAVNTERQQSHYIERRWLHEEAGVRRLQFASCWERFTFIFILISLRLRA